MLQALRIEASRPTVEVRLWSRPGSYNAKLYDHDFDLFRDAVTNIVRVAADKCRLYYFRDTVVLDECIPINDAISLRGFAALRVAVWVFENGPISPEVPPFDGTIGDAPPLTHSIKHPSARQNPFRDAVLRRDGGACVLCGVADAKGSMSILEAAHVIAARSPQEVLDGASLLNVFDTNNGVTLCGDCHTWFDKHMWYVRADNTVVVADALRMR